jgi:hypothetical protein
MIKSIHTLVANKAVPRVWGSQDLTSWAEVTRVKIFTEFEKRDFGRRSDGSWVAIRRNEEKTVRKDEEAKQSHTEVDGGVRGNDKA